MKKKSEMIGFKTTPEVKAALEKIAEKEEVDDEQTPNGAAVWSRTRPSTAFHRLPCAQLATAAYWCSSRELNPE